MLGNKADECKSHLKNKSGYYGHSYLIKETEGVPRDAFSKHSPTN